MHDKIFDKLCDILDDMARKEKLSASDVQIIDWATHAKKSMLAVDEMMAGDEGYSGRGSYERGGSNRSYRGSRSYRDGRSNRNQRRDSMGRYSGEYSGEDEYLNNLYEMMEKAPDEKTRQSIQRMIREME